MNEKNVANRFWLWIEKKYFELKLKWYLYKLVRATRKMNEAMAKYGREAEEVATAVDFFGKVIENEQQRDNGDNL